MKFIDINRKFTAAVSSYMAQGYYINAASMSGSQGEIAHIDLTDGKQIVRVLLDSFTEWEDYNQLEGLKLVVGIAADNVKPNDNQRCDVIWNNRLDVISCEKFYKLSSNRDRRPPQPMKSASSATAAVTAASRSTFPKRLLRWSRNSFAGSSV